MGRGRGTAGRGRNGRPGTRRGATPPVAAVAAAPTVESPPDQAATDARTRADGYRYYVTAAISDGFGAERSRAYEAIGFSRANRPGSVQVAQVNNGRLSPYNRESSWGR